MKHISYPDFAIEGIPHSKITKLLKFNIIDTLKLKDAEEFIWPYWKNPNPKDKVNAIISQDLDGWIFIYWNSDSLNFFTKFIAKLISMNASRMNYYSFDSQTDHYNWIISENGKVIREFEYCWDVQLNIGKPITEIEKKFIENVNKENAEFIFGEDVHNSVFEKTCGVDLKKFGEDTEFSVGTFDL
ncbi:hypothetical protein [uncultured Winogradskyella sp.]|uniref:hypothetical protein n=1 Tax=uncultured Winogradskyella sp. TaxID=395353 RepID=UPI002612BD19|nr:hypothetical protein [uncultured Winogradskyella sp.]